MDMSFITWWLIVLTTLGFWAMLLGYGMKIVCYMINNEECKKFKVRPWKAFVYPLLITIISFLFLGI